MAKTHQLQCIVVTPEKAVLDDTVDFVAVPMYDGEMGVLPGRAAMIGRLGNGELRTRKGTVVQRMYVEGGFVEVRDNVVTVLTQKALPDSALSVTAAKAELEQALQPTKDQAAQASQQVKQARARAKLRLARKKQMEEERVGNLPMV